MVFVVSGHMTHVQKDGNKPGRGWWAGKAGCITCSNGGTGRANAGSNPIMEKWCSTKQAGLVPAACVWPPPFLCASSSVSRKSAPALMSRELSISTGYSPVCSNPDGVPCDSNVWDVKVWNVAVRHEPGRRVHSSTRVCSNPDRVCCSA